MNSIQTRIHRSRRGFSLLELMVVILIMGVLATVVGINVFKQGDKAREKVTETQMQILSNALKLYKLEWNDYPPMGQLYLAEEEMDGEALDGWKRPFDYYYPWRGAEYRLVSLGKDGVGSEDDIEYIKPLDSGG